MEESVPSETSASSVFRMVSNLVLGNNDGNNNSNSNAHSISNDETAAVERLNSHDSNESGTSPTPSSPPSDEKPFSYSKRMHSACAVITQPSPPAKDTISPSNNITLRKLATTTPSRRSKRVRTPSTKKKESLESEKLFAYRRKSSSSSRGSTASNHSELPKKQTTTVQFVSNSVNTNVMDTTTATVNTVICKPTIKAPSPPKALTTNTDLLHEDILKTPPRASSIELSKEQYDDDLDWMMASTPPGYFAESPSISTTPPPPKRNTLVRTPFAKAFASTRLSPMEKDDDNDGTPNTKSTIPSNKIETTPEKAITNSSSVPACDFPKVVTHTDDMPTLSTQKKETTHLSSRPMPKETSATMLAPDATELPTPAVNSTNATPAYKTITSATPKKRKTPTSSTPLRRSARRASLLSSTKAKRTSSQISAAATTTTTTDDNPNQPNKVAKHTVDPINSSTNKSEMSLKAIPTTVTTTIDLAPDTDARKASRKRSKSRRASLAVIAAKDNPKMSINSPIRFDIDDYKPSKKRNTSRRASLAVAGMSSTVKPSEESKEEVPVPSLLTITTTAVPPLPPSTTSHNNVSSTTSLKEITAKPGFSLPPLPTAALSVKRGSRRASLSVGKASLLKSTGKSNNVLDDTPPSTVTRRRSRRLSLSASQHKPSPLEIPIPPVVQESPLAMAPVPIGKLSPLVTSQLVAKTSQTEHPCLPATNKSSLEVTKSTDLSSATKSSHKAPSETSPLQVPTGLANKPAPLDIPKPSVAKPIPLDPPHPLQEHCVVKAPISPRQANAKTNDAITIPKQVLQSQDLNAQAKTETTGPLIEYTPTMLRRSTRRRSMSVSSSVSSSVCKAPASRESSVKMSGTKRRLLDSTEKLTIRPSKLSTLDEEYAEDAFTFKIEARMITDQALKMFGNAKIATEPCVSARIFACYSLSQSTSPVGIILPKSIRPLIPLLKALVHVEMTSLKDSDATATKNKTRRVHFSGFDCSSTKPPVDSKAGSHSHQEDSIGAMTFAAQQIKALTVRGTEDPAPTTLVIQAVDNIIRFLKRMASDRLLLQECARSISTSYPPQRLPKAIEMYKKDFECVLLRLSTPIALTTRSVECTTYLEWRLVEFVGQFIRFHLRRLFNPPPLPLTTPSDSDSEASSVPPETPKDPALRQSRIHEIIDLELPATSRDTAVADGSISSLFSVALSKIYDYFGMEVFKSDSTTPIEYRLPDNFCASPVSQRGLGTPRDPAKYMSPDDLEELLGEIDEVYNFLGAFRACNFLLQLMRAPGVLAEVEQMGGWSTVENYTRVLQEHGLDTICAEDAHFAMIGHAGNMNRFFAKIEDLFSHMESKVALAEISIKQLARRYKTRTTSPSQRRAIFRRFPHVKVIAAAINEGQTRSASFPKVVPVSYSCD